MWPVGHPEGRNLEVPEAAEGNLRPQESVGRERNVVWVVWVDSCHQFFMSSPLHQNKNKKKKRRQGSDRMGREGREGKGMLLHLPQVTFTQHTYNTYTP